MGHSWGGPSSTTGALSSGRGCGRAQVFKSLRPGSWRHSLCRAPLPPASPFPIVCLARSLSHASFSIARRIPSGRRQLQTACRSLSCGPRAGKQVRRRPRTAVRPCRLRALGQGTSSLSPRSSSLGSRSSYDERAGNKRVARTATAACFTTPLAGTRGRASTKRASPWRGLPSSSTTTWRWSRRRRLWSPEDHFRAVQGPGYHFGDHGDARRLWSATLRAFGAVRRAGRPAPPPSGPPSAVAASARRPSGARPARRGAPGHGDSWLVNSDGPPTAQMEDMRAGLRAALRLSPRPDSLDADGQQYSARARNTAMRP